MWKFRSNAGDSDKLGKIGAVSGIQTLEGMEDISYFGIGCNLCSVGSVRVTLTCDMLCVSQP